MRKIIIIRGPSGSGKTTFAKQFYDVPFCEADLFWGDKYNFDPQYLGEAHKWCQLEVLRHFLNGHEKVIVSNTSINPKDLAPYYNITKNIVVYRTPDPWDADELFLRCELRGRPIPLHVIKRQIENYRVVDGEKIL